MKRSFLILGILMMLFNFCIGQQIETKPDTVQLAVKAANSWLMLVDEGKYSECWDEAALFFKSAVTKEQWGKSLKGIRPSFGALISREVNSAKYMTALPGAPDGEYVVIQYKTKYEKKENAVETITPMKDKDGVWRVSGYFIK